MSVDQHNAGQSFFTSLHLYLIDLPDLK